MEKLRRALPAVLGLVLFAAALVVLRKELHAVTWQALTSDVLATPASRLLAALVLTFLNYAVLSGYDLLAFAYIANPLSRWRVAGASLLAYAVSNSVGFAMFSGAAVRYRFYTRWGVTAQELSRIVFSYSVTFWLGLLALGGFSLVASPLPEAHELRRTQLVAPVGWLLLLTSVAYLVAVLVRRAPIRLFRLELPLPPPRIAFAQLGVSVLDWTLAAAVLYVLLPKSDLSFPGLLAAFLAAQLLGLASHVPGGVGVFEGLMVLLLKPFLSSAQLLPALVVYRVVYYLLPLTAALVALVVDELRQRRGQTARAGAFLGGSARRSRRASWPSSRSWPGLACSSRAPLRRRRAAWPGSTTCCPSVSSSSRTSSAASSARACCSCRRGSRAVSMPRTTWPRAGSRSASRPRSSRGRTSRRRPCWPCCSWSCGARGPPSIAGRRSSTRGSRPAGSWPSAGTLGASVWLGLFAFKHVEYSHELWWQFELGQEASRFLRSSVGAAVAVALVRLRTADAPRTPRGPRAHGRRPRGRRLRDRRAGRYAPVPGVPAGQGAALRRGPQGLRDVRHPGADLGRARRSGGTARAAGRADPAVPRTLRRLRRGAGVLRGRQGRPAPLRRLRPDLREAR